MIGPFAPTVTSAERRTQNETSLLSPQDKLSIFWEPLPETMQTLIPINELETKGLVHANHLTVQSLIKVQIQFVPQNTCPY